MSKQSIDFLVRNRLIKQFSNLSKSPLIHVKAGSGYGKTIAVEQFLHSETKEHVFLQLSRLDNSLEWLWDRFTASYSKINKTTANLLRAMEFPNSAPQFDHFIRFIQEDAKRKKLYFVFDDLDSISKKEMITFIENIVLADLKNIYIIILSKQSIDFDYAALYEKKAIAEITENDLKFTLSETKDLAQQNQINASHNIRSFYNQSEGWPFMINEFLTQIRQGESIKNAAAKVHTLVYDMMDKIFQNNYTVAIRVAAIKLTLLNDFKISMVYSLTQLNYEQMSILISKNPFVRYDPEKSSLLIHQLFKKYLHSRIMALSPEVVNSSYRLLAEWMCLHHDYMGAIDYYKKMGDYKSIWLMIKQLPIEEMKANQMHILFELYKRTPTEILENDPFVSVRASYILLYNFCFEEIQWILQKLEVQLDENKPEDREALGEVYLMLGLEKIVLGELGFDDLFIKASALLPEGSSLIDKEFPLVDNNPVFYPKSLKDEDIGEMIQAYERGMPLFTKLTHGCGAGFVELAHAEIELYKGHYKKAIPYLIEARYLAKENEQINILIHSSCLLLYCYIGTMQYDLALEVMQSLELINAEHTDSAKYSAFAKYTLGIIYGDLKIHKKAKKWLVDDELIKRHIPAFKIGRSSYYRSLYLLRSGHLEEAAQYCTKVEKIMLQNHRMFMCTAIYMLQCVIAIHMNDDSKFFQYFDKLYTLVKNEGFILFLILNGTKTRTFINHYKRNPSPKIPQVWLKSVENKAVNYDKAYKGFLKKVQQESGLFTVIELTAKEQQIMENLCHGLSRSQIAETHNIKKSTVNSRLQDIYFKLNATNAAEAVYIYTSTMA